MKFKIKYLLFFIVLLVLVLKTKKSNYSIHPWNSKKFKSFNNCYSYAVDEPDENLKKKREPGDTNGRKINKNNYTCSHFDTLLTSDYPDIRKSNTQPTGCSHSISLVLDKNKKDFHFYRLRDNDETWSHKRGNKNVSKTDSKNNHIMDPKYTNRDYGSYNYDTFCGYYCLDN
jgi:hypothetical protein